MFPLRACPKKSGALTLVYKVISIPPFVVDIQLKAILPHFESQKPHFQILLLIHFNSTMRIAALILGLFAASALAACPCASEGTCNCPSGTVCFCRPTIDGLAPCAETNSCGCPKGDYGVCIAVD